MTLEEAFQKVQTHIKEGWDFQLYWHSDEHWSAEFDFTVHLPHDSDILGVMGGGDTPLEAVNKVLEEMEKKTWKARFREYGARYGST